MIDATRDSERALRQPKAGQCQKQILPAGFGKDRVFLKNKEPSDWISQLSTDDLYEWHSSLPCSVSEGAEPLQAGLPAITPPRKKSPLSSSVRRLGAAADMDAGRENVSARAVCTVAPPLA